MAHQVSLSPRRPRRRRQAVKADFVEVQLQLPYVSLGGYRRPLDQSSLDVTGLGDTISVSPEGSRGATPPGFLVAGR